MRGSIGSLTLLAAFALPAQEDAKPGVRAPAPIDFAKVDRSAKKLPKLGADARYGIYLFGAAATTRVLAVLDKSDPKRAAYDVLWLDKNANGDLTEEGERIAGVEPKKAGIYAGGQHFEIGDYRPPGGDVTHTQWTLDWTRESGVRFRMLWRGAKVTMGGYGPRREDYAPFGSSLATAPVFVPGWDRPFEFERWIAEPLVRGGDTEFKVFVGNRGDRVGAFSTVDDKFLPADVWPVATLIYETKDGKKASQRFELKERC